MKTNINKFLLFSFLIISFVFPAITFSADVLDYSGLVKCDGVITDTEKFRQEECDFIALMGMVNSIVNWVFGISIPIAVASFAYSGFLYMTGEQGKMKQARGIMSNVAIGFIIMLCAWFIVSTLIKWVVKDKYLDITTSLIESKN